MIVRTRFVNRIGQLGIDGVDGVEVKMMMENQRSGQEKRAPQAIPRSIVILWSLCPV